MTNRTIEPQLIHRIIHILAIPNDFADRLQAEREAVRECTGMHRVLGHWQKQDDEEDLTIDRKLASEFFCKTKRASECLAIHLLDFDRDVIPFALAQRPRPGPVLGSGGEVGIGPTADRIVPQVFGRPLVEGFRVGNDLVAHFSVLDDAIERLQEVW